MSIPKNIFKAYDIRGRVPHEVTPDLAYRLGRAFVTFLGCDLVVVGMDMRDSSPVLSKMLMKGLQDQGADVINIGECSTPIHYHANGLLGADGSIMVTASHNPAGWNGFKLCRDEAIPISGATGIRDIRELIINNEWTDPEERGTVKDHDIKSDYMSFIKSHFKDKGQTKMVVDCGNGMGVHEMDTLQLPGVEIIPMYDNPDGNFPNHEANPLKHETLKDLQNRVLEEKADMGVAFDGDGDRMGLVDEKGVIVRNDFITALIAEDLLFDNKGARVLYDLRSSKIVKETILANGGKPGMCRVGHSFIKQQMRDEGAVLAGELSGHFYFKENFTTESSALAVVRIMNLMNKKKQNLSRLASKLMKFYQSGEINRKVPDTALVMHKIESKYNDAKISHLDGVTVEYLDWWANIRASNTEPVLRLNVEADTEKLMKEKIEEILALYGETG